jgi:Protein of unknown function (DUF1698)
MEGLMPVLMHRQGATRVLAADAIDHCHYKMSAIKHYYDASFEFRTVGLMYDLTKKLRKVGGSGFDVINLSGLLYHVFSPLLVLAGVRPLLKRHGLMIVSTNIVFDESFSMQFNNGGRLQEETNTFWYVSIKALDYLLRYLKLAPIDCLYLPHRNITSPVRYRSDIESGYCSIVCRANDDVIPTGDDKWMKKSVGESWESTGLVDWKYCDRQPETAVTYSSTVDKTLFRSDVETLDLFRALSARSLDRATDSRDAHILKLSDVA